MNERRNSGYGGAFGFIVDMKYVDQLTAETNGEGKQQSCPRLQFLEHFCEEDYASDGLIFTCMNVTANLKTIIPSIRKAQVSSH